MNCRLCGLDHEWAPEWELGPRCPRYRVERFTEALCRLLGVVYEELPEEAYPS